VTLIIGEERASDFRNPIGLLTDCHRRIEKFLSVLQTVIRERQGTALNDEHQRGLEVALRYFSEAAPKHTEDEEESLFPRMLIRTGVESTKSIGELIEKLNADHHLFRSIHEEVDDLGRNWLARNFLQPEQVIRMATVLEDLSGGYERHIAIEEHEIFPLAGRILAAEDVEIISKEMAQRRNLDIVQILKIRPN
jgi:hemerythrin-like domain-containing protein